MDNTEYTSEATREQTGDGSDGDDWEEELPRSAVEAAERLTRLAREAVDDAEADAYREDRDRRVGEHGFTPRVRDEDDTLVLYPEEWVEDGTVQIDRIEDTDRAVEVSLSGAGDPDDWTAIEEHNAAIVERVAEEHGDPHRANARAFADFMGNHYARPVESASADEVQEFLEEYYPRNTWPSEKQRDTVRASVRYVFEAADERTPM
ncbi:rnhA operon protein [Halobaculum sp. CBA1158]|uniref:DUF7108 family protein n=1 Tax=Halobaculum sp. CBA1158 TaxID=2904243 RepID=UPI001F4574CD|nr:rnhA operon protein [Halobaculum sp. CBA1158]UIP00230.1 rnhA operon protein [Halobaculum sp. CBA1158]